jgi:hypothetical protein
MRNRREKIAAQLDDKSSEVGTVGRYLIRGA